MLLVLGALLHDILAALADLLQSSHAFAGGTLVESSSTPRSPRILLVELVRPETTKMLLRPSLVDLRIRSAAAHLRHAQ